jgi:hypothetical protein
LKKRTKKLLLLVPALAKPRREQKFLVPLFSKSGCLLFLTLPSKTAKKKTRLPRVALTGRPFYWNFA